MKIILITGYARSGKDTVANLIKEKMPMVTKIHSLAEPIKKIANFVTGNESDVDNTADRNKEMSIGYTPRRLWQIIGTELFQDGLMKHSSTFRDKVGRTIWCRCLHRTITNDAKYLDTHVVIIPDVRFPHEVSYFLNNFEDVTIIKVKRKPVKWFERLFMHRSEKYIDSLYYDLLINNAGSIDELLPQVDDVVHYITKGHISE